MPARTFRESIPEEGITFTLEGVTASGGEWTDEFHCLPVAPAKVIDDFALLGQEDSVSIIRFLRDVLAPADLPNFNAIVDGSDADDRLVGYMMLLDVMRWLSEVYTGRPTSGQETSRVSLPNTGPSSVASSLAAVTIPASSTTSSGRKTSSTPRSR